MTDKNLIISQQLALTILNEINQARTDMDTLRDHILLTDKGNPDEWNQAAQHLGQASAILKNLRLMLDGNDFIDPPEPGYFVTQDYVACDLCGQHCSSCEMQRCTIIHGDKPVYVTSVCPQCIKRFGFEPVQCVNAKAWQQYADEIERKHWEGRDRAS
ncbi:hypothetical protein OZX57_06445 [Bifidobacterium sp. ESL0682]|uniref:hypothetical protein n=1 Tax=Bifidobacterium sp. ESL0682 TaxID=2983212 RepID=UPI0023F9839F|nr:hypothetical protein [Bifidobacterium sp. ESL0682]WEV41625.1 hypothetical protein OZX57_06445 [Bifidobacterium sp. ESL0682]